jgi:hypothetical protein
MKKATEKKLLKKSKKYLIWVIAMLMDRIDNPEEYQK